MKIPKESRYWEVVRKQQIHEGVMLWTTRPSDMVVVGMILEIRVLNMYDQLTWKWN